MQLTDAQALRLIRNMRDNTESAAVAALLDWVIARVAQHQGVEAAPAATGALSKADRKAARRIYMRNLMRAKRAAARERQGNA